MASNHEAGNDTGAQAPAITYLHPAQPPDERPVVAAIAQVAGQEFPLTVQRAATPADGQWLLTFGDLADEGRYATFAEALRVAHERIERDAAELARSLRDGGY